MTAEHERTASRSPSELGEGGRRPAPLPVREALHGLHPPATAATPNLEAPASKAPAGTRSLTVDGAEWIATIVGASAYGTGAVGSARLLAIGFARPDEPGAPRRVALVAAGSLDAMTEGELRDLWRDARPLEESGGSTS